VDLYNVVAVMPALLIESSGILSGHPIRFAFVRPAAQHRRPVVVDSNPTPPAVPPDPTGDAPGARTDGSGPAFGMELARVLAQYQFEKTLVFLRLGVRSTATTRKQFVCCEGTSRAHVSEASY